jgi:hypothetical protein
MKKRKTSINIVDLPLRTQNLSEKNLTEIFGGCYSNKGEACEFDCNCCHNLKCNENVRVSCGAGEMCSSCQ